MKFLHNWRDVLARAWSIRLMLLAGLLSGLEVGLAIVGPMMPIHPGIFAALSAVTVTGAFVSRLVAQNNLPEG